MSLLDRSTSNPPDPIRNPFSGAVAAGLYNAGRPYHHPRAVQRIRKLVGSERVDRALDVGCGTGLSTIALTEVATHVIGIDTSPEMVALAPRRSGVEYRVAQAEKLPFDAESFDAITVASGVHWFDQDAFYREACRVLRPGAWLAVYDHYFSGETLGESSFSTWLHDRYLAQFPTPPRGRTVDSGGPIARGFAHMGDDEYEDPIGMSREALVSYLLTQSNCIAALRDGLVSLQELREWLLRETEQFFTTTSTQTFRFYGQINCLRRAVAA